VVQIKPYFDKERGFIMWKWALELLRKAAPTDTSFDVAVLIDMQPYFVNKLEAGTRERLIQAQVKVIRYCAEKDIPLIVLEYEKRGTTLAELRAEARKVSRVVVITKGHSSGFQSVQFRQELDAFKADSLLLMGVNASCCVLATALDAHDEKYRILTAPDLIADGPSVKDIDTQATERWFRRKTMLLPSSLSIVS